MSTTNTGHDGEELTAQYLSTNGYKILSLNWKRKIAEIDIVAKKADIIYFVEVKTRSSLNQGDGFDYITKSKLHHMERAAELWVSENKWHGPYEMLAASVNSGKVELIEV